MECGESRRAEAPCASVNSEATLGIEREQAGAHPLLCRSVPLWAPGTLWVPSPSGPPACRQFRPPLGPRRIVGSDPLPPPALSSVLSPSGPLAHCQFWFSPGLALSSVLVPSGPPVLLSSFTCELEGCLAGHTAAGSQAWRLSPHSAGSGRAASVQGRPPGAPLPRLSGQLPDRTVP